MTAAASSGRPVGTAHHPRSTRVDHSTQPLVRAAMEADAAQQRALAAVEASRRGALKAAAGVVLGATGAIALAGPALAQAPSTTLPRRGTPEDRQRLAFLQSVSLAARAIYDGVIAKNAVTSPQLEVLQVFASHHTQTGDAWDATLGTEAPRRANFAVVAAYQPRVNQVATASQALALLLDLENAVVATYLDAIGELQAPLTAQSAAAMLPPASQRAVVIAQALGRTALPSFESTSSALTVEEYPLS